MVINQSVRPTHGSYVVCGKRYHNKLKAVADAVSQGHWIHWDYHDQAFGAYNWSQEPTQPLDSLYIQRAKLLRNRYDHLAIEFSGGSDSWNALYSFARAGLHVDTVIHKYADRTVKSINDYSPENRWAEGKFQAWPAFQKLRELDPSLTWYTWDIVNDTVKGWQSSNLNILFHNNLHPGSVIKTPDLGNYNPAQVPDLPTTAMISGVDKPIIEFDNNCFYLVFYDYAIVPRGLMEREALGVPMHDVLFYWDPECCDLIAKQAHAIVNYFQKNPQLIPLLNRTQGHNRDSYYNIVNQLIYPDYQSEWTPGKNSNMIAMEHESWFFNNNDSPEVIRWKNTVNQYSDYVGNLLTNSTYQHFLKKDGTTSINTLPACPSRRYFLAKLNKPLSH